MRTVSWLLSPIMVAALACAACATTPASARSPHVTLGGHSFSVEVAATSTEQTHGLMDRTSMPADHGMLFVFPQAQPLTFWMKDTLIPLDMLFFDEAHRLVTVRADVPPCKADPCPTYASTAPARYVLELNAGTAAKLDLHKGDVITFSDVPSGTQ
ncbi:MAG TPA: DUF192 domain-containing protein [Rhodanobacteraceae bacterium]|nr:DUF192 domain-containing protein [Rhodanobacteraceae bacterium]